MDDTVNTNEVMGAIERIIREMLLSQVDFSGLTNFDWSQVGFGEFEGEPVVVLNEGEKTLLAGRQNKPEVSKFLVDALVELSVSKRLVEAGGIPREGLVLGADLGLYVDESGGGDMCRHCPKRYTCPQQRSGGNIDPLEVLLNVAVMAEMVGMTDMMEQ